MRPADRAARADADDDGVEAPVHLLEDFGAGRRAVGFRVVGIAELVDVVVAALAREARAEVLVVLRMALLDVGAREHDLRAHGAQVEDLLLAHLVRQHQHDAVALLERDEREAEPGVAGGRLDDRAARFQVAAALRFLDHREPDAVLDRARRILQLELEEELARPGVELPELEHRRPADHLEHVAVDLHR